jgi:phosphonate transport system substrate-binding protein
MSKSRVATTHLLLLLLLAACQMAPSASLDLTALTPLPEPVSRETLPLRVAVAAVISPQGTIESYGALLDYLEARLQRPVQLEQRASYAETNELLRAGLVDLAFVCTGAYIDGQREFGMSLLVAPVVDGAPAYHSWVIVPAGSKAQSLSDLRGAVFAFTDPLSYSGRLYPTYLLTQLGETPESYFQSTFYTFSHDAAIRAVAEGVADGAAVDSLIYEHLVRREPALSAQVRIVHRSPPFGIPPVVVSPSIRPQLRAELEQLFLGMATDADGLAALGELNVDRFVLLDDSAYDSARELERLVHSAYGSGAP